MAIKYAICKDDAKNCPIVELVEDLHAAVDVYREDLTRVMAKLEDHSDAMKEVDERVRKSEMTDISTTHIIAALKDNFEGCRGNCQTYIRKIDDIDRRVHTMETKFDTFTANINKQLSDISAMLKENRETHKANEASIMELKKQMHELSWINEFRDTLLKKIYQIVSMGLLVVVAITVLGFVATKPYLEKILDDKLKTHQEIQQLNKNR
jgi:chromosome segregation ATPase